MSNELRNFLTISYEELEDLNLKAKEQRMKRVAAHKLQEERLKYLADEKTHQGRDGFYSVTLKAACICLIMTRNSSSRVYDNLTFDGSSIRGFTGAARERLAARHRLERVSTGPRRISSARARCWCSAKSSTKAAHSTPLICAGVLKGFAEELNKKQGYTLNAANEIEGFPVPGH